MVTSAGYGVSVLSAGEGMATERGPWEGGLGVLEQLEEEQAGAR